jgi:hypothetical protein
MEQALRESMFHRVPPFINFVPLLSPDSVPVKGPQYWDQEGWDQVPFFVKLLVDLRRRTILFD